MEDYIPEFKLKYNRKSDERFDLIPPETVSFESVGNKDKIPFNLEINQKEVEKLLKDEGITNGGNISFVFVYPGADKEFGGANLLAKAQGAITLGSHQWNKETGHLIKINMEPVWTLASFLGIKSHEEMTKKYNDLLASFLAHEVGHSRQPLETQTSSDNISKTFRSTSLIKDIGGTLTIIDGLRRIPMPWLGPMEAPVVMGEALLAEQIAYRGSGEEKFAREYQKLATNLWKNTFKITLKENRGH